ncbi:MAG: hypothetical protein COY39_02610 [Alphaproteobacteria bacterium CG_4_10_14_0_8_um_filter_37_21]|nr:MAG: hypothetical protein COY39_02610 [Alphaproteobacteria bacterium CG_4_10_14_0_8_um_filter_37_21]
MIPVAIFMKRICVEREFSDYKHTLPKSQKVMVALTICKKLHLIAPYSIVSLLPTIRKWYILDTLFYILN